ncbi:universal stress protein [Candidatus Methylospira mobilis]|uniref:Universal stress protein n=1 Tax=Candidatus Methylospira mobilis TaxID=1808979 RepID=A0A5Q0BJV5_9GAMM|nr:universal stress protein [Candidatus Methylospira mobilis]QFY42464.1 universal stress protein [Candidatus Methylospira mobilis]WNV04429.1 universal stress protein [Candidatus Methylospira mobilis]
MKTYRKILLAVDFADHLKVVVDRAQSLTELYQADLTVLHVVEYIPLSEPVYGSVLPLDIDLTEQLAQAARKRLHTITKRLNLPDTALRVEIGSPKSEIIRVAEESKADLIVLGSHGRHGIALLLGSTATSVLHHATCDVLAVKLKT